jgi:hypothetical protein
MENQLRTWTVADVLDEILADAADPADRLLRGSTADERRSAS